MLCIVGAKVKELPADQVLIMMMATESPKRWNEIYGDKAPYMDWDSLKL